MPYVSDPPTLIELVRRRLDDLYGVDPQLRQIPLPVRQAVIALLNRVTNGVEQLLSLRPTDQGWVARFLENGKPVSATWDGQELVTVLLADIPTKRRSDARKNCVKGRWCVGKTGRGTCIAANRQCRQQLREQEMVVADRISEALRQAAPPSGPQPVDPWVEKPDVTPYVMQRLRGTEEQVFSNRSDREDDVRFEYVPYLLAEQGGISSARYLLPEDDRPYTQRRYKQRAVDRYLQELIERGELLDGDLVVFEEDWNGVTKKHKVKKALRYNAQTRQLEPVEVSPERERLAREAWDTGIENLRRSFDVDMDPTPERIQREEQRMARWAELDNRLRGRQPRGAVKSDEEYERRAVQWARAMGLDDAANGFDTAATRAHDVSHPVLHEMVGLDSRGIQSYFGTNSLVAEEAAVFALEWMSRGGPPNTALSAGLRLARYLTRGTPEAPLYRTKEFRSRLSQMVQKMYDNPDFHDYLKVVRKQNRISQTVGKAALVRYGDPED